MSFSQTSTLSLKLAAGFGCELRPEMADRKCGSLAGMKSLRKYRFSYLRIFGTREESISLVTDLHVMNRFALILDIFIAERRGKMFWMPSSKDAGNLMEKW